MPRYLETVVVSMPRLSRCNAEDYDKILLEAEARVRAETSERHESDLKRAHERTQRAQADAQAAKDQLKSILAGADKATPDEGVVLRLKDRIASLTKDFARASSAERNAQLGLSDQRPRGTPQAGSTATGPIKPPLSAGGHNATLSMSDVDRMIGAQVQARLAEATAARVADGARQSLAWFCDTLSGSAAAESSSMAFAGAAGLVQPDPAPWFGQVPASVASPSSSTGPSLGPQACVGESALGDAPAPLRVYYSDGRHVALGVARLAVASLNGTVSALRGASVDVRQYLPPGYSSTGSVGADDAAGSSGCCDRVYWAVHPVFGVFYRLRVPLEETPGGAQAEAAGRGAGVRTVCFRKGWAAASPQLYPLTATAGGVVGPLVRSLGMWAGEAAWAAAMQSSLTRHGSSLEDAVAAAEAAMAEHGARCDVAPALGKPRRAQAAPPGEQEAVAPRSHLPDVDPLIVALPVRMRRLHLLPALLRSLAVAARAHRPGSTGSTGSADATSQAAHSDVRVLIVPVDMGEAAAASGARRLDATSTLQDEKEAQGAQGKTKQKQAQQQGEDSGEAQGALGGRLSGLVLGPAEAMWRVRALVDSAHRFTGLNVEVALPDVAAEGGFGGWEASWERRHALAGGAGAGGASSSAAGGGLAAARAAALPPSTLRRLVAAWTESDVADAKALPRDTASLGPSAAALLCSPVARVLVTALQAAKAPGSHVLLLDGASLNVGRDMTRLASWGVVARAQAVVALPSRLRRGSDGASLMESLTRWASSAVDRTVSPVLHSLSSALGWQESGQSQSTGPGSPDILRPYVGPIDGGFSGPSSGAPAPDANGPAGQRDPAEWAAEAFWAVALPDQDAEAAAALLDAQQRRQEHAHDAAATHPTGRGTALRVQEAAVGGAGLGQSREGPGEAGAGRQVLIADILRGAAGGDDLQGAGAFQADDEVHAEEDAGAAYGGTAESEPFPDETIAQVLPESVGDDDGGISRLPEAPGRTGASWGSKGGEGSVAEAWSEAAEEEAAAGQTASLEFALQDRPTTMAATRHDWAMALWAAVAAAHAADVASADGDGAELLVLPGRLGLKAQAASTGSGAGPGGSTVLGGWGTDGDTLTARLLSGLPPVSDSCVAQRLVWGLRHGAGVRVPAVTMASVLLDDTSLPRAIVPGMPAELWLSPDASGSPLEAAAAAAEQEAGSEPRRGVRAGGATQRPPEPPRRASLPEPEAEQCDCSEPRFAASSVPAGVLVVDGGCGWRPRHALVDSPLDRRRVVCSVGRWVAARAARAAGSARTRPLVGAWAEQMTSLLASSGAGWTLDGAGPGAGLPLADRRLCPAQSHIGHTIRRFHPARGLEIVFRPSGALMSHLEQAREGSPADQEAAGAALVAAGQRDHHGAVMLLRIGLEDGGMAV